VLHNEADAAAVLLEDPLDGRTDRLAVRSLVVEEFDDRHRRVRGSDGGGVARRHVVPDIGCPRRDGGEKRQGDP